MKPITQEWVTKAEGDWAALGRELRARKAPNYDDACFHAQQCAEKYLKARLQEASVAFPRTHNVLDLLSLVLPVEPTWTVLYASLDALNDYAVVFRYPGRSANREEAREALRECRAVRDLVRLTLGLPP
jgi:HEPN domain-containing protein